jgi:hypothetical protein
MIRAGAKSPGLRPGRSPMLQCKLTRNLVTLKDGRIVDSWSEEWRLECLEAWNSRPPKSSINKIGRSFIVTLCQADIDLGERYGRLRDSESRRKGHRDRHGASFSEEQSVHGHIIGVSAEIAAARLIGVPDTWRPTVNAQRGQPDIPPNWQVRATERTTGRLIVRPSENPEQRFILVIANPPRYDVAGFILGEDAMRQEWLKDAAGRSAPAYWVDREFLHAVLL